jgi:predicted MFS family arabinose efflux permease
MPAWLLALLLAAFALYTDDYVIAGVLPEIAADLEVSDGVAGQLVTVFSATVAVAAPVAGVVLARVERRRIFAAALTVFVAANVLAALTPSFMALMVLRVLAALAAAAATPSLFAVAAARAPEGRRGRYLAVISLGVTGSITVGVPAGTWVGGAFGWRATFLTMAALGALSAVAILSTLPRTTGQVAPPSLPAQLRVLTSAPVALGLVANGLLITGSMMLLTYLAPFLTAIADADIGARGALFAAAGVAGTSASGQAALPRTAGAPTVPSLPASPRSWRSWPASPFSGRHVRCTSG